MALAEAHSPITSHVAPDAAVVRAFLEAMIAKRAFDELIASTVALVEKMRDLNTDLTRQLAAARGAHPPSETTFRLKRESAANDGGTLKREKQKPPPKVSPHGRSNLPEHLARVPEVCSVPPELAVCPGCDVVATPLSHKLLELLDVVPARYFVRRILRETVACQECHAYVCTADGPDTIVDRGCLGNALVVEAIVDHYDDAVLWERNARLQGAATGRHVALAIQRPHEREGAAAGPAVRSVPPARKRAIRSVDAGGELVVLPAHERQPEARRPGPSVRRGGVERGGARRKRVEGRIHDHGAHRGNVHTS